MPGIFHLVEQGDRIILVGLGVRYTVSVSVSGTPVTLRASVDNLFDKNTGCRAAR